MHPRRLAQDEVKDRFACIAATRAVVFRYVTGGVAVEGARRRNQLRRQTVHLFLNAIRIVGAVWILTIGQRVIVVVERVVTDLGNRRADRVEVALDVSAIDVAVTVVV